MDERKEELQELIHYGDRLLEEMRRPSEAIGLLQEALRHLNDIAQDFSEDAALWQTKFAASEEQNRKLQQQLDNVTVTEKEHAKELQALRKVIDDQAADIQDLDKDFQGKLADYRKQRDRDMAACLKDYNEKLQPLLEAQKKLADLKADLEEQRRVNEKRNRELGQATESYNKEKKSYERLKEKCEAEKAKYEKHRKDNEDILERVYPQLQKDKESADDTIASLRQDLKDCNNELSAQRKELENVNSAKSKLEDQLKDIGKERDEWKQKYDSEYAKKEQLEFDLQDKTASCEDLNSKLTEAHENYAKLTDERDGLKAKCDELQEERDSLAEQLRNAQPNEPVCPPFPVTDGEIEKPNSGTQNNNADVDKQIGDIVDETNKKISNKDKSADKGSSAGGDPESREPADDTLLAEGSSKSQGRKEGGGPAGDGDSKIYSGNAKEASGEVSPANGGEAQNDGLDPANSSDNSLSTRNEDDDSDK
ncbi:MAG: hypothetical protein Q4F00_07870 [bacterium]|nr:hypothetical protein [bacterium]